MLGIILAWKVGQMGLGSAPALGSSWGTVSWLGFLGAAQRPLVSVSSSPPLRPCFPSTRFWLRSARVLSGLSEGGWDFWQGWDGRGLALGAPGCSQQPPVGKAADMLSQAHAWALCTELAHSVPTPAAEHGARHGCSTWASDATSCNTLCGTCTGLTPSS